MDIAVRIVPLCHDQDEEDARFWQARPIRERIEAVEILRARMALMLNHADHGRLQRVFRVIEHA